MRFSATVNFGTSDRWARLRLHVAVGPALAALMALAGTLPSGAARIVPTQGAAGYDFAVLSPQAMRLGTVSADGQVQVERLPMGGLAAAACGSRLYVCSSRSLYLLQPGLRLRRECVLGGAIRDAAPMGAQVALLAGGHDMGGGLRGAQVWLWPGSDGRPHPARQVKAEWNPFFLSSDAQGALLVGVRKTAHFDPVYRARPFLYRRVADDLQPLWQGTSFAHPFVAAVLAEASSAPGVETCALELLPGGLKRVTAYTWTGAAMEAVAMGEPARLGDSLQVVGTTELAAFATDGRRWRLLVLAEGNKTNPQNVSIMWPVATSPWLDRRPAAWTALSRHGRRWLVYSAAEGELQAVPLVPATFGLPTR